MLYQHLQTRAKNCVFVIQPNEEIERMIKVEDALTTNCAFGGKDFTALW